MIRTRRIKEGKKKITPPPKDRKMGKLLPTAKDRRLKNIVRKPLRSAAVMITGCKEKFSYADALEEGARVHLIKQVGDRPNQSKENG